MRVACVDKTANDRLLLEEFLVAAFGECRASIGHMPMARFLPMSKEEVLVSGSLREIVIGPGFAPDDILNLIREVKSIHKNTPIFVLLAKKDYDVRNVRRLSQYAQAVISQEDTSTRIVYELTKEVHANGNLSRGHLITVKGVKGGVGASSIVAGLGHAAHCIGKTSVVVDLSACGEIAQFFLSEKCHSADMAQFLLSGGVAETQLIQEMLVQVPNGMVLLPPPGGGLEVRDKWLRDPATLESSLSVIDVLQELFDVVIIDMAHAEGIYPFALECRADIRLLVTANEPASVHLLATKMDEYSNIQDGTTRFLLNQTGMNGLSYDDALDFIAWSKNFKAEMLYPIAVPFDRQAGSWIGTGNSLYTEGHSQIREVLSTLLADALGLDESCQKSSRKLFSALNMSKYLVRKKRSFISFKERKRLPYLSFGKEGQASNVVDLVSGVEVVRNDSNFLSNQEKQI